MCLCLFFWRVRWMYYKLRCHCIDLFKLSFLGVGWLLCFCVSFGMCVCLCPLALLLFVCAPLWFVSVPFWYAFFVALSFFCPCVASFRGPADQLALCTRPSKKTKTCVSLLHSTYHAVVLHLSILLYGSIVDSRIGCSDDMRMLVVHDIPVIFKMRVDLNCSTPERVFTCFIVVSAICM